MAGARFVEDLLARGGRERFDITVFGDEPHGNYNRILLSGVLAGTYDARDISINPLEWYAANGVTLHAGARVGPCRPDRASRVGQPRPVRPVRHARARDRQPAVHSAHRRAARR